MKRTIIFLLLAGMFLTASAQFTIKGEFRPRTEYNHGLKNLMAPNSDATIFTSQRTRMIFNYENEFIATGFTLQDVRAWGSTAQLAKSDAYSALHEAWVKVKFAKGLSLKAGRQELVYDDHRIFGNVGWTQQARSHDLALFSFNKLDNIRVDLGIAYNQNATLSDPYALGGYKAMQFLWINKDLGKKMDLSLLFLNNGMQYLDPITKDYSILYSVTSGGRLVIKANEKINAHLAGYLQNGTDASNTNLNAYYVAADASLGLLDKNKLGLTLGFEMLSGNDMQNPGTDNNAFTPFYGTNHKFNGFMDYFYVGNHANSVGLQDIYLNASYKMGKFAPALAVHLFSSAAQIYDASTSTAYDAGLGTELDLSAAYKLNNFATFKAGYSQMLGTSSLEFLRGSVAGAKDEMNNWAWLMLVVSPTFFTN